MLIDHHLLLTPSCWPVCKGCQNVACMFESGTVYLHPWDCKYIQKSWNWDQANQKCLHKTICLLCREGSSYKQVSCAESEQATGTDWSEGSGNNFYFNKAEAKWFCYLCIAFSTPIIWLGSWDLYNYGSTGEESTFITHFGVKNNNILLQ